MGHWAQYVYQHRKRTAELDARRSAAERMAERPQQDPSAFDRVLRSELRRAIINTLSLFLTGRERCVLAFRFGLVDGREYQLDEIGSLYGVGKERIRNIESDALRKLQHPSRSKLLKEFVGD